MSEEQQWLVCFDTDRIKQYLLATNRLKEIRGGSALIADLDDKRKKHLRERYGEQNVVYSAGGGAAVLVPTEQEARELIAEVEREFRTETFTASITGVSLPPDTAQGRNFGARMALAGRQLRRVKAAKAELSTLPVEPYMRLCSSCGQHPAAEFADDESGDWLCRACAKKRGLGGREREGKGFFAKFIEWTHSEECEKAKMPADFDTIGACSSPPGYVGFIALDGNHIGSLLDKPTTVEEYRHFSEGLEDLTRHQTFEALFEALKDSGMPRGGIAPFEIVLIGGDDVLLITTADIAIEIALAIAEGFEQHSPDQVLEKVGLSGECKKLTMAGGVVLAHADFPIPAMHTLAEALQKSAKKLCPLRSETGAIDFLVVSGSDTDLDEMRRSIPHRRPYTLEEMEKLLKYVRDFKKADFPTSQLQAMYQALFDGEVNAQLASIAALGRLGQRSDKTQHDLLKKFFADFGVKFNGQLPPWDAGKRSALVDLVELYPFIQGQGGRDGKDVH
jgi:CRISPR/Cas system-associated protein Cas10 (large subunit of type III CRISPR-Cas system)